MQFKDLPAGKNKSKNTNNIKNILKEAFSYSYCYNSIHINNVLFTIAFDI